MQESYESNWRENKVFQDLLHCLCKIIGKMLHILKITKSILVLTHPPPSTPNSQEMLKQNTLFTSQDRKRIKLKELVLLATYQEKGGKWLVLSLFLISCLFSSLSLSYSRPHPNSHCTMQSRLWEEIGSMIFSLP